MADARPASHRITILHEGERYRFARSRSNPLVICRLTPHHTGRSFWRDMSQEDWTQLPAPVRAEISDQLRLTMGGAA